MKLSAGVLPPSIARYAPRITKYIDFEKSFIDGLVELAWILRDDSLKDNTRVLKYYYSRSQIPSKVRDTFYARANRDIKLMGHSMFGAFQDSRDKNLISPALKNRKVKIKVLLLNPFDPKLDQMKEVQERLETGNDILKKIDYTIVKIRKLKQQSQGIGNKSKLQIRVTDRMGALRVSYS